MGEIHFQDPVGPEEAWPVSPTHPLPTTIFGADGIPLKTEPDGAVSVSIQDQVSPALSVRFNTASDFTTLTNAVAVGDRTFDVDAVAGFAAADLVVITHVASNRFYSCTPLSFVGNTVTADTPIDFAFPAGSIVSAGSNRLNVNGAVTPKIFSLRASDPGIPLVADVTRILFECQTNDPVALNKFGDITGGLTNGLVLRLVNGITQNMANFKTNSDIKGYMFDFEALDATKPVQGINGFASRWTFAGQDKMGVAIRLGPDDDLEVIIQDDLSSLVTFRMLAQGHIVIP